MASAFLVDMVGQTGTVSPDIVSGRLKITKTELASALGLSRDSVSKQSRVASQPLPSFGDQTAEDLVHAGRGEAVKRYLSRIAEGGFA